MAARLSLVVLVVLVTLPCYLARRGRGEQHYRTEADRRETRRKLLEQRDPRRTGWSESETRRISGEVERRRQSLENSKKPFEEKVTRQGSTIFIDFQQKSRQDDKQESNKKQRGKFVEEVSAENDFLKQNDMESIKDFVMINEEGSGEVPNTELNNTKKEGTIVMINGRRALIKKRKRGKKMQPSLSPAPLSEILNRKIIPSPANTAQDNNEPYTNYRAKYPRRLSKEGRQFRVKKRRRQGAASRNMETREETVENKVIMQKKKNPNKKSHIQTDPLSQKSSHNSFKIPNLFKDLNFPVHNVKEDLKPALPLPFHTIDLENMNFAKFDAQFGGSPQRRTGNIRTPISFTTQHQLQILQPELSPAQGRSLNLFRGHPAQGIDMDTGAYSFTTKL